MAYKSTWRHSAVVIVLAVSAILQASPGATQQPTSAAPKRGGTLVHPLSADPNRLLACATTDIMDQMVNCKIYEGLIRHDMALQPQPLLATSWKVSADEKTFTFNLRKGVRWHDGVPFTSADVRFTFEKIIAKHAPRARVIMPLIDTIETPDADTVIFKFKAPYGPFFTVLGCSNAGIAPKHLFDGKDILTNPAAVSKPIGTGPFKMGEWAKGQYIILERNDDYWDKPKSYLDRIVMKVIPNASARTLAFKSGEIDFLPDSLIQREQWKALSAAPGNKGLTGTGMPADDLLMFNVRRKPLADTKVRQAILTALDRKFIADKVYQGMAYPGKSSITPEIAWAYNKAVDYDKLYPYNPDNAKKMLDDAGYKPGADGVRFTIRAVYDSSRAGYPAMMEVLREQLKAVGIQLTLEGMELQSHNDKVFKKFDFDITVQSYGTSGDPTTGIQRVYVTDKGTVNGNPTGYSNPKVDELFKLGATQASYDARAKYFYQVQQVIGQDIPTVTLLHKTRADVVKAYVQGVWKGKEPYDFWGDVWLNK